MNTVLVTGGTGFIGSHTCLCLLEMGFYILIIDSNVNSSKKVLNKIKKLSKIPKEDDNRVDFLKCDIRNEDLLNRIFKKKLVENKKITSVIHFAALKSVSESDQFPLKYWDTNVCGTISLLKVMSANDCHTLIFSSSATIYGYSKDGFLKESTPISPINTYGKTKSTIEQILNELFHSQPNLWRIANLRYFNPIGAHPSGFIGEDPFGMPNNIFPLIIKVASREIDYLKIFGNDYDTKDGTGVRDYIHVMDVSEGHMVALDFLTKNEPQIIQVNLGTGKGTSVLELISIFEKVNNLKIPYKFVEKRKGDVAKCVADNSLAQKLLKWSPKKTIEEMCQDGWKWKEKKILN